MAKEAGDVHRSLDPREMSAGAPTLVPFMYFAGSTRYAERMSSVHVMPDPLFAAENAKPSVEPAVRPTRPNRFGPCL